MTIIRKLTLPFILLLLSGCAGAPWIVEKQNQATPSLASGKARVVFLKPSKAYLASIFLVNVYEVNEDKFTHLGMMGSGNKIVHDVSPGKKRFLGYAGKGHILDAELEAGKTYYVILRYIHGGGFQLRPVRPGSVPKVAEASEYRSNDPEFPSWVKEATFVDITPDGKAGYEQYYTDENLKKAYDHAVAGWEKKNADERAQLTLNKSDSINLK